MGGYGNGGMGGMGGDGYGNGFGGQGMFSEILFAILLSICVAMINNERKPDALD